MYTSFVINTWYNFVNVAILYDFNWKLKIKERQNASLEWYELNTSYSHE